jgi:TIGR00252 family protein
MNKRELGSCYEKWATSYLIHKGYQIIENNFRCRFGEIDIIAKDKATLVFVEVKYRKNDNYGTALEAVSLKKQKNIRRVSEYYIMSKKLSIELDIRYDIVAILGDEVTLLENAF